MTDYKALYEQQLVENKKLKQEFEGKEHWQQTMVAYMDNRDEWWAFDEWFRDTIDEEDKKQEWVKIWMDNIEYEDSDEEEEDSDEEEEDTSCDFCECKRKHLVKRDAGYDEWTCDSCHKEQYPEEYEDN